MGFLRVTIKVLIMLAMLFLMALPFILEANTFRRDKEKKISYKRFRILIYTGVYVVCITILMYFLKEVLLWIESLSFIQWISNKVAVNARFSYSCKVLTIILVNFAIGMLYRFIGKFVRIGLNKKDLLKPAKKNGEFSFWQKTERKVIKYFYSETWFFVASILKWLNIILSSAYALIFLLYQIPAFFGADWIPYNFIFMLFTAGYLYPTITLLALWEMYFFLEGIKRIEDECPELIRGKAEEKKEEQVNFEVIDKELKRQFKDYYVCDVDLSDVIKEEELSEEHHKLTKFIGEAVANDDRTKQSPKEMYLACVDKLVENKNSLLINGGFFSEFSLYFLRYLSAVIARGDNVVFVCNTDDQIDEVYNYITEALEKQTSIFCNNFSDEAVNFDDPIWRVLKVSGDKNMVEEASVDETNILVTSLSYLCSPRFETEHSKFITLIDAVVFVDVLNTVNTFNRQLAILNTRLKHLTRNNSLEAKNGKSGEMFRVRYMSRQVRYICFDDTRTPGLDKVLKNMLSVEFEAADIMKYNEKTLVRCFNYEGTADESGRTVCPQFFNSQEEIGAVINMAVLCLAKGAKSVAVFADNIIPYANFAETIASNTGQVTVKADVNNIRINKHNYDTSEYSVVIAIDSGNNLPETIRKYAAMVSDKPSMVIIFSRPYLLRDFYFANVEKLWSTGQMERIPVEEGTKKDIAQKILVKANSGGISKEQILNYAQGLPQFEKYVRNEQINEILREVLEVYGVSQEDRLDLFKIFEYSVSHDFDENGKFCSEERILLRRQGKLFDRINGRDMVLMHTGEEEIILPMPRSRMTQNYIAGQNLLYNGNIYYIRKIDTASGKLYARLAVGGKNDESYLYVQSREYRIEFNSEQTIEHIFPTKHVIMEREEADVNVKDVYVSVFRAPMEVITSGYYSVNTHTLSDNSHMNEYHSINDEGNDELAKQVYRRYGKIENPVYSTESILKTTNLVASDKNALMMSIRICGGFGADTKKTATLAAVMLNEIIRSMFPSVADSVAVCPVIADESTDEQTKDVLKRQPKLTIVGENDLISGKDFELVIIEDCSADLGVVSVLMSAGDDMLKVLFTPIFDYLNWYFNSEKKSNYLYYGADGEPSCFDFEALYKLSRVLGDDKHDLSFTEIETVTEYESCDFCENRYPKGDNLIALDDGRKMCKACAENLVGNNKKILKSHLDRAKIFLESTYGITLDEDYEFCFESTVKIVNTINRNRDLIKRGADVPLKSYIDDDNKKVYVECSVPSVNLSELLVRELTYVWQLKHLPEVAEDLAEGHIALVAVSYLRFLNENTIAASRTTYYESTSNISGEGYRKLASALLANPQYNNNPFKYLLAVTGGSSEQTEIIQPVRVTEGDYGQPYVSQTSDRATDGNVSYFYYNHLEPKLQTAYNVMVEGIKNHLQTVTVDGCTSEEIFRVDDAIRYDRPDLFWYKTDSVSGNQVTLFYGATKEEAEQLQKRMDEVIPKYLEGIDDTMSAYDVAIRLHVKIISTVDYDTIALRKQEAEGGPAQDKIDYLRTICGVFLDGKVVCEGYARAMQYLLQKCGVECAEVVGYIVKENGERDEAHAWNILKIDGEYYYLDTTWDDSSNTIQAVKKTNLGFDYFCITTEELLRTRDTSLCPTEMPDCTAKKANYYYHNGLVLDSYDLNKIKEFVIAAAEGDKKSFTFKCTSKALYEKALKQLCSEGHDGHDMIALAARKNKKIKRGYTYSYDKAIRTITIFFKYK